jgi:hypothetical protein
LGENRDGCNNEIKAIQKEGGLIMGVLELIEHEDGKPTYDAMKAEKICASKKEYSHTKTDDLEKCPIGKGNMYCIECDFTDIIGYCCHPIDIQTEIKMGRAQPLRPNFHWAARDKNFAERESDHLHIAEKYAFRKVDRR